MWATDSEISKENIGEESLKTAKTTSKYLQLLASERYKLNKMVDEQNVLVREKREYYMGQATAETYKKKPFHLTILKSDVPTYINSDSDIVESNLHINAQTEKVEFLKAVISILNNRRWEIKNYIEHMKFINGGM